jgi:hypothetical protein
MKKAPVPFMGYVLNETRQCTFPFSTWQYLLTDCGHFMGIETVLASYLESSLVHVASIFCMFNLIFILLL